MKRNIFKKNFEEDPSDVGIEAERFCKAASIDSEEERFRMWNSFLKQNSDDSLVLIKASMKGFVSGVPENEILKYSELFYKEVLKVFDETDREYAETFYENLSPWVDDFHAELKKIKSLEHEKTKNQETWTKCLTVRQQKLKRKISKPFYQ